MTMDLRLVIFDVDGTLVDSQADILASMAAAFGAIGLDVPERQTVLGIVGLSLDRAIRALAPDVDDAGISTAVEAYKTEYQRLRATGGTQKSSPLYDGIRDVLDTLHGQPEVLLGVATGKSRRGLVSLMDGHQMGHLFVTQQCADDHPSKPHPSMVMAALAETVVAPEQAVMIGDTSFDMDMAKAAGVAALGVTWGYHSPASLSAADRIAERVQDLPELVHAIWSDRT